MKQISHNEKLEDFANILNFATFDRFPKICDYCGEYFEADLNLHKSSYNISCPICHAIYYVAYNDLNDFYYLEFAVEPPIYVCPEGYHFQLNK